MSKPAPSLSKLVNATAMLVVGDQIAITASSQKFIRIESSGRLVASGSEGEAARFQVEFSGPRVHLKFNGKYLAIGPGGYLYASATTQGDALPVGLLIVVSGAVVLTANAGRYWVLKSDGAIDTRPESALGLSMEFGIHFTAQTRKAELLRMQLIEAIALSECEKATAAIVYQVTVGFFLAIGLGPYFVTEEAQPGLVALIRSNQAAWNAVQAVVTAARNNPKTVGAAVFTFLGVLYAQNLLWSVVRIALTSAGWWVAFRVVAKIIEVVLLPEAEAVDLLASFTIWSAQTVIDGVAVGEKCTTN
jgi:hypothetical protein